MRRRDHERPADRGSALFLVLLVSVIVCLLSLSMLLTAQTESRIARNERLTAQALYVAESGAWTVKSWFDRPGRALGYPADSSVVVRQRTLVDENDPYGAPSSMVGPEYKAGIDLDGDGGDDLFRRPYRGGASHTLLGRAEAPDMVIEDADFLGELSRALFGPFPAARAGLRAMVRRIEIYAPPYVRTPSGWTRYGVGTIRVRAGIYRSGGEGTPQGLAERTVTLVINELPYTASTFGVVHSCRDLTLAGKLGAHWGAVSAVGEILTVNDVTVPQSLPRAVPPVASADRLWTDDPEWVTEFGAKLDPTQAIPDPWLRLIAGGSIQGSPSSAAQPLAGPVPPAPGQPAPWPCCDNSNILQGVANVDCPERDYRFWKRVAMSGDPGLHYFSWAAPDRFLENGVGPARTFSEIFESADGREGLFFFDTIDRRAPRDEDGDGAYDNLTPEIIVSGDWRARGFVYLNAERFRSTGLNGGVRSTLNAPAEPYVGKVEGWIDLAYPAALGDAVTPGDRAEWTARGPDIEARVSLHGILYNSGTIEAGAGGLYYGSVTGRGGVVLDGSGAPGTQYFWDASLAEIWPPETWNLPRVTVSRVFIEP